MVADRNDALERGSSYSLEYRVLHVSGETRWVAEHGRPVLGPDGLSHKAAGVIMDITRQKAAEKSREIIERQLRNAALHDSLTGLPNRTLFHESVAQAIFEAQQNHGELALFILDLDRFKEVNDALGHVTGDQVLQEVGRRLLEALREGDTISRVRQRRVRRAGPPGPPGAGSRGRPPVRAAIEQPIDLEGCQSISARVSGSQLFPATAPTSSPSAGARTRRCTWPRTPASATGSTTFRWTPVLRPIST